MLNLQIIGTKFKHCNELANFVVRFHDLTGWNSEHNYPIFSNLENVNGKFAN